MQKKYECMCIEMGDLKTRMMRGWDGGMVKVGDETMWGNGGWEKMGESGKMGG